jgi:hypothetical protein
VSDKLRIVPFAVVIILTPTTPLIWLWYSYNAMANYTVTNKVDFWKNVFKTSSCWFWKFSGKIKLNGRFTSPVRASWELTHGKLKSRFSLLGHTCDVETCMNPVHLLQISQKDVKRKHSTPEDFWKRVNKNGPVINKKLGRCWNWTGGTYKKDGYGQVHYQGAAFVASRLAWTLERSEIPPDTLVCHKCDNRLCVRPSHLFLGKPKDNTTDMMNKGRHKGGLDYIRTKAHRKAISDRMKGQRNMLGRKHSEATKKKISETRKARGLNGKGTRKARQKH